MLYTPLLFCYSFMLSIHKFSLSVCLFTINVKKAELIGPKFCVGPKWPQGRFMNLCLKIFIFVKFWKCAKKNIMKSADFFCFILYKEKMFRDKATIKSWNRRWARSTINLSVIYFTAVLLSLYVICSTTDILLSFYVIFSTGDLLSFYFYTPLLLCYPCMLYTP